MSRGASLCASCVAFEGLAKVQAWHSCESGLAAGETSLPILSQHVKANSLSSKCSAWLIQALIKRESERSLGSWLNLPIVSYLPHETQAALKQGHIFAGYFGLICKSMDATRTTGCLISSPCVLIWRQVIWGWGLQLSRMWKEGYVFRTKNKKV